MHQVLAATSPSHEVSSPEVPSMTSSVTSHDIRDVLYRDHISRQVSGLNSGSSNFMMKQQQQQQGQNMGPSHDFPYMTPFFYHLQQAFLRSQHQQTNQKMVMDSILQQSNIINEHRKNLLNSFIHQLPPSFHHFQSGKKFHPYSHNGKVMMMMMTKEDDPMRHESKMESETGEDNYEGISSSPRNKKNLYSPSCAGSDVTTERNSPLDDVKLTSSPFKGWSHSKEFYNVVSR